MSCCCCHSRKSHCLLSSSWSHHHGREENVKPKDSKFRNRMWRNLHHVTVFWSTSRMSWTLTYENRYSTSLYKRYIPFFQRDDDTLRNDPCMQLQYKIIVHITLSLLDWELSPFNVETIGMWFHTRGTLFYPHENVDIYILSFCVWQDDHGRTEADQSTLAWRTVCVVPSLVAFFTAGLVYYGGDDSSQGNFHDLRKQGSMLQPSPSKSFIAGALNVNTVTTTTFTTVTIERNVAIKVLNPIWPRSPLPSIYLKTYKQNPK